MCCVVQNCICLGISDSHIIHSRDFPFLTLAVLAATLLAGMQFVNHMWWRRWVSKCRLNRNKLAIFYNPSIVLRFEDGFAACFICCSKSFLLGGDNFSSVDSLILFRNVLSLSVSISQPSKVSLLFTRSCCD